MFIWRAYELRETLSDTQLERLEAAVRIEVERYRDVIKNSPADRLQIQVPFLAELEAKLANVSGLLARRRDSSS
jgi:hypothetical protein